MKHPLRQLNFRGESFFLTLIYLLIARMPSGKRRSINNNSNINININRMTGRNTLYLNQFILYTLLTLLINSVIEKSILFVDALGPRCKCIRYLDTYGKEFGTFTSPNWPSPYEDSIECILYTFQGESDQLVEITFDEFDLQRTNIE